MSVDSTPEVDFLLLADYAEVIGGKLYLMGGAWDRLTVRDANQPMRFGVAVGVLVPWSGTNQTYQLRIAIQDADGQERAMLVESSFVTGRPPDLRPGSRQRVLVAVNSIAPPPPAGEYAVVASIDGQERHRVSFAVLQG